MRGNRRRLSGTCAMPSPTIRCAGVATRSTPFHRDGAGGGPDQARDHPHERGLARAVRTDDADRFPVADLERDVEQGLECRRTPRGPIGARAWIRGGAAGDRARRRRDWVPRYTSITRGIRRDLGRSALRDLLAVIEHHHAVHHAHQDAHDVLDPDDRDAELLADPAQHQRGLIHLVLVEAAQALVGEQELGLGGERLGQLELLERGRAEPVHRRRRVGRQPHQPERALGGLEGPAPRSAGPGRRSRRAPRSRGGRGGGTAAESGRCGRCRG